MRDDDTVAAAVAQTVARFGAIDIVVNNASAIDVSPSATIAMKRYDLMQDVNTRGTFLLSRTCVPHLERPTTRTSSRSARRSASTRSGSPGTSPTRWRSSG